MQTSTNNLLIFSIINLVPHRIPIAKLYVPWDSKTLAGFWGVWAIHAMTRTIGAISFASGDCLCTGFIHRTAAQFQLLHIRLRDLAKLGNASGIDKGQNIDQLQKEKTCELIAEHQKIIELRRFVEKIFILLYKNFSSNKLLVLSGFL